MEVRKFNIPIDEMIMLINGDKLMIEKFKNEIYKKCDVCGKEFVADGRSDQTRCSLLCTTTMWQKNNIEKVRKTKREWARNNKKLKATLVGV